MRILLSAIAATCIACAAPAALAGEALADCVTLSPDHAGTRFGSQYLLIKDGDRHYRIGFGGSCDAIARSAAVTISTGGESNRLCATGTVVSSKRDRCAARNVEMIDADDYVRYAKRRGG